MYIIAIAASIAESYLQFLWWFCRGCSPLPIPNREVKPLMADGTAQQCGRVGSCHIHLKASSKDEAFFYLYPSPSPPLPTHPVLPLKPLSESHMLSFRPSAPLRVLVTAGADPASASPARLQSDHSTTGSSPAVKKVHQVIAPDQHSRAGPSRTDHRRPGPTTDVPAPPRTPQPHRGRPSPTADAPAPPGCLHAPTGFLRR